MSIINITLWLFNIAMEAMAHLPMIFPARNLHLEWIVQFAMLYNQMVSSKSIMNFSHHPHFNGTQTQLASGNSSTRCPSGSLT